MVKVDLDLGGILLKRINGNGKNSSSSKKIDEYFGIISENEKKIFSSFYILGGINIFYFRTTILFCILLMLDAIHDFGESNERNKLNKDEKSQVTKNIIIFYKQLLSNKLKYNHELSGLDYLYNIDINLAEAINNIDNNVKNSIMYFSGNKKYDIAKQCLEYLGIKSLSINDIADASTFRGSMSNCSSRANEFKNYLKVVYSNLSQDIDVSNFNILLAVDADKSKYSTANISNIACDMYTASDNHFKIFKSLASDYDSASTPGLFTLIQAFAKKNIPTYDIIVKEINTDITYNLLIGPYNLMSFTYTRAKGFNDIGQFIKECSSVCDKNYDYIISKYENKNITQLDFKNIFEKLKNVDWDYTNGKPPIGWGNSKSNFPSIFFELVPNEKKKKLNLQKVIDIILPVNYLFNIMFEENEVGVLKVNNFLGINIPKPTFTSRDINNTTGQVSVNNLTTYKSFTNAINNNNFNEIVYYTSYKTLGDLGQIIALTQFSFNRTYDPLKIFVSFDQICSMISSLFINATIFENSKDQANEPIICYVTKYEYENYVNMLGAATSLVTLSNKKRKVTRFGKNKISKKQVKKKTNKISYFRKQKSKNFKIQKLAKKYSIKTKGKSLKKIISEIKKAKKKIQKTKYSIKRKILKKNTSY
jgi:hypothetical protein